MTEEKELQHATRRIFQFLEANRLTLIIALGAVVIAVGVRELTRSMSARRERQALLKFEASSRLPDAQRLAELESLSYTIKGTSSYPWVLLKLGKEYFQRQDLKRAEQFYLQASSRDNGYVAGLACLGLACVYEEQRDFARARQALTRALEVSGNSAFIAGRVGYRRQVIAELEKQTSVAPRDKVQSQTNREKQ